jgi:hypothetical protein
MMCVVEAKDDCLPTSLPDRLRARPPAPCPAEDDLSVAPVAAIERGSRPNDRCRSRPSRLASGRGGGGAFVGVIKFPAAMKAGVYDALVE